MPTYRPIDKVKDPRVYKGKTIRELNKFIAILRATF